MHKICVIAGDGIGKEVIESTVEVLKVLDLDIKFDYAEAGWDTFTKTGQSVPKETLDKIRESDSCLAGAFTSPSKKIEGFQGAIRYMRRELNLYANLRPAKTRPVAGCLENVDMLMVRENTQGLYVERERRYDDVAIADAVVTKTASDRIARVALKQAQKRKKELAIIHKANVLPLTTGLFLDTAMAAAQDYPEVHTYDVIVDAAAMRLVRYPSSFDVLVTTNLFGDILSDLMAGLVGGLGLAPSANIGDQYAIFEPVHGSAPDIAGKAIANPTATILTAAMMLEHIGETEAAKRLDEVINKVLSSGPLTPDLGGKANTKEFTDAVISNLVNQ